MYSRDIYLRWIERLIAGQLDAASVFFLSHSNEIKEFAERFQSTSTELFRGLCLPGPALVHPNLRAFVSYTESRAVASWFAWPESVINQNMHTGRGVLLIKNKSTAAPLFHWSWSDELWKTKDSPFSRVAKSQKEVVLGDQQDFELRPLNKEDISLAKEYQLRLDSLLNPASDSPSSPPQKPSPPVDGTP